MKIGVLIKKFEKLSNWELRVIDNILNHNELELSLLILDGREDYEIGKSLIGEFKRLLKSKNILGELILKIQIQIERSHPVLRFFSTLSRLRR